MAAAACKAPSSSPRPLCPLATPTLFERSYRIPPRWPFPPIDLVMEERPGRCDYYRSSEPCCKISETIGAGPEGMIERPVREVLIFPQWMLDEQTAAVPPTLGGIMAG